ncbi:MAG: HAD family phosphatase [Polyangiaceae bacterium]|nr:HAD family phosphatase [Polyangiaceae bacterium]
MNTLFDFNGVLLDDEHVHAAAMAEVLAPLGVTVTLADYFERYFVFDDREAFRAALTDAGRAPSDEEIARLVRDKEPVYLRRVATEGRPYPGAAALVRAAASLGVVGVVSGALRHEIELALDLMDLREQVAFIVSAEDTTRSKPDPEGYLLAKRALTARGHAPRAVVVEDSPGGVAAAKAAGLTVAAVLHTSSEERLRDAGADLVVARIDELSIERLAALA